MKSRGAAHPVQPTPFGKSVHITVPVASSSCLSSLEYNTLTFVPVTTSLKPGCTHLRKDACLHALRPELHALEDAIEHLRQRGLGSGLVDVRARHKENVVARPHSQQQRL